PCSSRSAAGASASISPARRSLRPSARRRRSPRCSCGSITLRRSSCSAQSSRHASARRARRRGRLSQSCGRWPDMRRRDKWLWSLAIVVVVLVAARAALPSVLKDEVNRRLKLLPQYDGHVEDVDVALWRGAYSVNGVRLVKTGVKSSTRFFEGDRIDFSVEWKSLLHGRIVAECAMWRPNLNLVRAESKEASQLGQGVDWAG